MTRHDASRPTTLEATDNVKTCTRGFGTRAHTRDSGSTRERADRVFRDIHGTESQRPTIVLDEHYRPKRRDRRRRRFSATLGCGLCRPRRCSRTVSGRSRGYRRGHQLHPGLHQRRRLRRHVRRRDQGPGGDLHVVSVRHADRSRRAADLHPANTEFGSFIDRYPRVNRSGRATTSATGMSAARCNFWSEFQQKPAALAVRGVLKIPTGGRGRSGNGTGKTDFLVDFIGSKDVAADRGSVGVCRLRVARRSRTASTRPAARSGGARAGVPDAEPGAGRDAKLNGAGAVGRPRRRADGGAGGRGRHRSRR